MALADSKFDDLSDADIDSLIGCAIPKNTEKATGEYLFWKVRLLILNFSFKLVEVFLRVVNSLEKDVMLIKSFQKVI